MIVGDKSRFAIESEITKAYVHPGVRALGLFLIHAAGRCYGVRAPDATLLACSFDAIANRITRRGNHTAPFAAEPDAAKIADAFRDVVYAPDQEGKVFFGIPQPEFYGHFDSGRLVWATDGDEAFDDGSYVLQFDVADRVRLIAFRSCSEGYHHAPGTLSDVWLEAGEFYQILEKWRAAFEAEWASAPKIHEADIVWH